MAEILSSSAPTISFDPPQKLTPGMVYQPGIARVNDEGGGKVTIIYHHGEPKTFSGAKLKSINKNRNPEVFLLSYDVSWNQQNIILCEGREYKVPPSISLDSANPILTRDAQSETLTSFQIRDEKGADAWIAFDHNGCFLGKKDINNNIAESAHFSDIKNIMGSQHVAVVKTDSGGGLQKYTVYLSDSSGTPKDTSITSDKPITLSYGPAGVVCMSETRLGATSTEGTWGAYNEKRFITFYAYGEYDTLQPQNIHVTANSPDIIAGQRFQWAYILPNGKSAIVYTDAKVEKFSILYNGETKDFTSELITQAENYKNVVGWVDPLKDIRDFSKPIIQAPNRLGFSTKNRSPNEIFWVIGWEEEKKAAVADSVADVLKTDEDSKVKALMTPESCLILQQKINAFSFEKTKYWLLNLWPSLYTMKHEPVPWIPKINTFQELQFCEQYLGNDSILDIKYNGRNAIDWRRISHDKEYIKALKEKPKLFMMFYYRYILFVKTLAARLPETEITYEDKVVLEKQQQNFITILLALSL